MHFTYVGLICILFTEYHPTSSSSSVPRSVYPPDFVHSCGKHFHFGSNSRFSKSYCYLRGSRTQSRCSKGLQLKVRARRAPCFIYSNMHSHSQVDYRVFWSQILLKQLQLVNLHSHPCDNKDDHHHPHNHHCHHHHHHHKHYLDHHHNYCRQGKSATFSTDKTLISKVSATPLFGYFHVILSHILLAHRVTSCISKHISFCISICISIAGYFLHLNKYFHLFLLAQCSADHFFHKPHFVFFVCLICIYRHDICQNFYPTGVFGAKILHKKA